MIANNKFLARPGHTYNEVMMSGPQEIAHTSRPNMVLMLVSDYQELTEKAALLETMTKQQAG